MTGSDSIRAQAAADSYAPPSVELHYNGSAAIVGALARMLREEGVEVEYEPPVEERGGAADGVVDVVLYIADQLKDGAVGAAVALAVDRAVARFRERFPRNTVEKVEDDPPTPEIRRPGDS